MLNDCFQTLSGSDSVHVLGVLLDDSPSASINSTLYSTSIIPSTFLVEPPPDYFFSPTFFVVTQRSSDWIAFERQTTLTPVFLSSLRFKNTRFSPFLQYTGCFISRHTQARARSQDLRSFPACLKGRCCTTHYEGKRCLPFVQLRSVYITIPEGDRHCLDC